MNFLDRMEVVGEMLRKYKFNKERMKFLQNQIKRLTPETHKDYIECRMFSPGQWEETARMVMEDGEEVALLNKVELTAEEYKRKCEKAYKDAKNEIENELRSLEYYTAIVEDGLETLDRISNRYKYIVEEYYIKNKSMEDIACSIHVSRSRCYEICKEGVKLVARVIYGHTA